jgi:hypothetical protein
VPLSVINNPVQDAAKAIVYILVSPGSNSSW